MNLQSSTYKPCSIKKNSNPTPIPQPMKVYIVSQSSALPIPVFQSYSSLHIPSENPIIINGNQIQML